MFKWLFKVKEVCKYQSVYRQTVYELSQMSDRDLADIGISRGSIEEIATQAAKDAVEE